MFNVGVSVCNTPGAAASFPPDIQEPLGQRASGSWTLTSEDLSQTGGLLMSSVNSFILPTIPVIAEHLLRAWQFSGLFLAGKESPAVLPAPPAPSRLGPYNLLEEHR